ncbi:MAG: GSCFA domain-containing protein [Flavobacteriaceae bacterium]|nr:GSCFA domain-containing protein [Flavobacteriaceae bacterium]
MKLQTQISLKKQVRNLIDYQSKLILIGSCFSENIGDKLNYYKFQSLQNPFGILFHSLAIEQLITYAINEKEFTENDVFELNDRWHSFDAHSYLSADKNTILTNLNKGVSDLNKELKKASHIIITLGTAWVYRYIATDKIVANCHKIPQKKFLKELLTPTEIKESLEATIALIKSINKNVIILLTVSPVRHLKDGFTENTLSKSHLISGIHSVVDERKNIHYFPSYEIMMDELRDYRFYKEDMIHPNNTAIEYIWDKFKYSWVSEEALENMKEIDTIQKGLAHKPFNKNSTQHQNFLKDLADKQSSIIKKFPFIKF